MTIDDIKDKVPSSITLVPDEDSDSIDVLVNGVYTGFLYDTPEGMYFKTLWYHLNAWDDYANEYRFVSRFKYDLLITSGDCRYNCKYICRIYRLIK